MAQLFGVCLLPASGEFVYDTWPARGAQWNPGAGASGAGALEAFAPINCFNAPGGTKTDYSTALDQLQSAHPECQTVALVCAWFGNSTNAATCAIYPSTNFIDGAFQSFAGGDWAATNWQVSGLTRRFPRPHSHFDQRRLGDLWRHAVGSIHRPLHTGSQVARSPRHLLPLPPDGCAGKTLAREHHPGRRPRAGDDDGGRRLPWLGGAVPIYPRQCQSHGGLLRGANGFHLSPLHPSLCQSLRDRGRRRPVPDRLGTARPGNSARPKLDARGDDRRQRRCFVGLSVRRRPEPACCGRPQRVRRSGPDQKPDVVQEPDRLFARLVSLERRAARGRRRAVAASRLPVRLVEHRPGLL